MSIEPFDVLSLSGTTLHRSIFFTIDFKSGESNLLLCGIFELGPMKLQL